MGGETFLAALRERGVRRIRRVRFRDNRHVLLSVSREGSTLNAHECFARAPRSVMDAVATFLKARRGSAEFREAVERIRAWPGGAEAIRAARRRAARRAAIRASREAALRDGVPIEHHRQLRSLYARLNRSHFRDRLPGSLPLRISRRMERRFGQVQLYVDRSGARSVLELAVNAHLMYPENELELLDTLLHEMAHIEAWLVHGDRGHGEDWRRVAERVGCEAAARTDARIRRRNRRSA